MNNTLIIVVALVFISIIAMVFYQKNSAAKLKAQKDLAGLSVMQQAIAAQSAKEQGKTKFKDILKGIEGLGDLVGSIGGSGGGGGDSKGGGGGFDLSGIFGGKK